MTVKITLGDAAAISGGRRVYIATHHLRLQAFWDRLTRGKGSEAIPPLFRQTANIFTINEVTGVLE
jgi:hypothetical protein